MSADRPAAARFRARLSLTALAVSVASALTVGLLAPAASADSLTDQRVRVAQQLASSKAELSESSRALSSAGVALQQAQGQLEVARTQLAQTQAELTGARQRDVTLAKKLKRSRAELAAATAAVVAGQRALDKQKAIAADVVRDQYQQQTNLLPIAVLLQNTSTGDLQTRLQWSTTMFDTTSTTITRLDLLQAKLTAQKARQAQLTRRVGDERTQARENLLLQKRLERQARAQADGVGRLVAERQSIESAAAVAVAQDRSQYAQLTRERARVEQRIATRIAQAKAAAAREAAARQVAARQAAARQAAQQATRQAARQAQRAAHRAEQRAGQRAGQRARAAAAAAQQRAERARAAARRASKAAKRPVRRPAPAPAPQPAPAPVRSGSGGTSGAHHGFAYPVSAPITSPYGMRLHPVTHIYKLHDGTDFGAGCGTPIRAAYSGRVAERYYNGGYGNRLMIDHGYVDGRYVTTGYNHAIRYSVSVGQHVSKGQVVGYVGSTGYSTGCHLHLMVWLGGRLVNPMTW